MMARCIPFSGGQACRILINTVLIAAALFLPLAVPVGKGPVAVFAAPWSANAAEIVAQAGGQLLAAGPSPRIIMAVSSDDDFVRRLYRAGAILVMEPSYAIGCHAGPLPGESQ
jgi:hypothetical protein